MCIRSEEVKEGSWTATERIIPRKGRDETDRTVLACIMKRWEISSAEFSCELVIGI